MFTQQEVKSNLCRFWRVEELKFYAQFLLARDTITGELLKFDGQQPWGTFRNFKANDRSILYPKCEGFNFPKNLRFKTIDIDKLKDQQFYCITLGPEEDSKRLKNPFLLKIESVEILADRFVTPEQYIKDRFNEKGENPSDASTIASQIQQSQLEMYTKPERFLFEMIQNADDMPVNRTGVEIKIELIRNFLIFKHSGRHFQREDVEAITDVAKSSKKSDVTMTGYKGIGFKSVFTDAKRVYIKSGDYSFKFDKEAPVFNNFDKLYARRLAGMLESSRLEFLEKNKKYRDNTNINDIPWQIKPLWVENIRSIPEIANHMFGMNVCIALEISKTVLDSKHYDKKIKDILAEPRLLLFLKNIRSINYATEENFSKRLEIEKSKETTSVIVDGQTQANFLTFNGKIAVDNDAFSKAGFAIRKSVSSPNTPIQFIDESSGDKIKDIPEKLAKLDATIISFAAQFSGGKIRKIEPNDSTFFNYLPTEDSSFGLPFLVNADFITTSSREHLQHENLWNEYLLYNVGHKLVEWLGILSKLDKENYLSILPAFDAVNEKATYKYLWKGINEAVDEVAFLPSSNGFPILLSRALVDKTGFQTIAGTTEFSKIVNHDERDIVRADYSLHTEKALKEACLKPQVLFSWDSLLELIKEGKLNTWLHIPNNNSQFIKWLKEKGRIDRFIDAAIFLDQNNTLRQTSGDLYRTLGNDVEALNWAAPTYLHPEVEKELQGLELPLQEYNPKEFLSETLSSTNTLASELQAKESNYAFWRYVFEYAENLDKTQKSILAKIPLYDYKGVLISDIDRTDIYSYDADLVKLLDKGALPAGHVYIIADDYLPEEQKEKWIAFCSEISKNSFEPTKFLKEEIIKHVELFNDWCSNLDDDSQVEERYQGNVLLWEFAQATMPKLAAAEQQVIHEKLGSLPVLQEEKQSGKLQFGKLNKTFLSDAYSGNTVEDLLQQFKPKALLVSAKYGIGKTQFNLSTLWIRCGINTDSKDLIEDILSNIDAIDENLRVDALLLCAEEWERLEPKQKEAVKRIPVKTQKGEWSPVRQCLLGSDFTGNEVFEQTLPSVSLETFNLVSPNYLKDQHKADEVTAFFKELDANAIESLEAALELKIPLLVQTSNWETNTAQEKSVAVVRELNEYFKEGKLEAFLKQLENLPLLTSLQGNETFVIARDCFLPSVYAPTLDLEAMKLESEHLPPFLSEVYHDLEAKSFLLAIQVMDDFRIEKRNDEHQYAQLPDEYRHFVESRMPGLTRLSTASWIYMPLLKLLCFEDVANSFWIKVSKSEDFVKELTQSLIFKVRAGINYRYSDPVDVYPAFFIFTNSTLRSRAGRLEIPANLYSHTLKGIIHDDDLLPSFDLSHIKVGKISLEEWLGVKQSLDLKALFAYLETRPYHNSLETHKIWEKLGAILNAPLSEEDNRFLNEFKEKGCLPSQNSRVWKPVKELFNVNDASDFGIRMNEWVVNSDTKKVASLLGSKTLNQSDLQPQYEGGTDSFKELVKERLKFIAFFIDSKEWKNELDNLLSKLNSFNFVPTEKIVMRFNAGEVNIESTDKELLQISGTETVVYVLRSENRFEESLCDYLKDTILGLPKRISSLLLKDILLRNTDYVLKMCRQHDNENFPAELDIVKPIKVEAAQLEKDKILPINTDEEEVKEDEKARVLSDKELEQAGVLIGRQPTNEELANINLIAQIQAFSWLKDKGYEVDEAEENREENWDKGLIEPIFHPDDSEEATPLTIMCRSAQKGILYVNHTAWENLKKPDHHLVVIHNGNQFTLFRDQESLSALNEDAWIMKLEDEAKGTSLNRFLKGEGLWGDKLHMIIRLPGVTQGEDLFRRNNTDRPLGGMTLDEEQ